MQAAAAQSGDKRRRVSASVKEPWEDMHRTCWEDARLTRDWIEPVGHQNGWALPPRISSLRDSLFWQALPLREAHMVAFVELWASYYDVDPEKIKSLSMDL